MFSISNISISTDRKQALRAGDDFKNNELELISRQFGLSITPIDNKGDQLGYIFSIRPNTQPNQISALLTAHAEIEMGKMLKPLTKSRLRFVAPQEAVLESKTQVYANTLSMNNAITDVCNVKPNINTQDKTPEYTLESDSTIFSLIDACEVMFNQNTKPLSKDTFDLIVLKPNKGRDILMSELVPHIDGRYTNILSHICRAKPIQLLDKKTQHFSPLISNKASKSFL